VDVFISYEKTTGLSYASHLKEALRKINIFAFVADEDIPKGTKWGSIIDKAITDCEYFVVVMTMGAILSPDRIKHEIELANQLNKHIIPCKPYTVDRMLTRTLPLVYELQQVDFDVKEDLADKIVTAIIKREQEKIVGRTDVEEAAATELSNVQTAVVAVMVDNNLTRLPNPVVVATNDMGAFPDATSVCGIDKISDPNGNAYTSGDKDGYILYQHDITADGAQTVLVNYVATRYTKGTYTMLDAYATVTQVTTGYE
jgi:ligand-binding SRPBCC domain-containing protein